jgi:FkbM family methyltransferase
MRFFGRRRERIIGALMHFPTILSGMLSVFLFRRPLQVLKCYLQRSCPRNLVIEMRRGYQIHLSGDPDDLVTVLVVLGRKDYGDLHLTGVVVDVGAHLGTFTLYALSQGARLVYAYEPDPVLYQYLIKNLSVNGLTGKVRPFEAAVVGSGPGQMAFLAEGNASGHIASSSDADTGAILVKTVTLADIVLANQIEYIDFLKLDCEGSEYGIIFDTPQEIWNRVGTATS